MPRLSHRRCAAWAPSMDRPPRRRSASIRGASLCSAPTVSTTHQRRRRSHGLAPLPYNPPARSCPLQLSLLAPQLAATHRLHLTPLSLLPQRKPPYSQPSLRPPPQAAANFIAELPGVGAERAADVKARRWLQDGCEMVARWLRDGCEITFKRCILRGFASPKHAGMHKRVRFALGWVGG